MQHAYGKAQRGGGQCPGCKYEQGLPAIGKLFARLRRKDTDLIGLAVGCHDCGLSAYRQAQRIVMHISSSTSGSNSSRGKGFGPREIGRQIFAVACREDTSRPACGCRGGHPAACSATRIAGPDVMPLGNANAQPKRLVELLRHRIASPSFEEPITPSKLRTGLKDRRDESSTGPAPGAWPHL